MRLTAPETLTDGQRAEWDRMVKAMADGGRPATAADRSILALYVQLWTANGDAYAAMVADGMAAVSPRGRPCPSPAYKAFSDTGKLLRDVLRDLGCVPAVRKADADRTKAVRPLEY